MPIDGVVLQMKSMHIDTVTNFPFPTPPDRLALRQAETVLRHLGAIEDKKQEPASQVVGNGQITELGRAMALFPLSPRYSRMLVSGRQHGCLPYIITVVAALSVGDPFLREEVIGTEDGEESSDNSDDEDPKKKKNLNSSKEAKRALRKAFFQSQKASVFGTFASDTL
jgi:ATP-dependent RNA helicase DHX37/DHR1